MERFAGRIFLVLGILFLVASFLVEKNVKIPFGRLPGDIIVKKDNFTFYLPLATSILISMILTVIFSLIGRK